MLKIIKWTIWLVKIDFHNNWQCLEWSESFWAKCLQNEITSNRSNCPNCRVKISYATLSSSDTLYKLMSTLERRAKTEKSAIDCESHLIEADFYWNKCEKYLCSTWVIEGTHEKSQGHEILKFEKRLQAEREKTESVLNVHFAKVKNFEYAMSLKQNLLSKLELYRNSIISDWNKERDAIDDLEKEVKILQGYYLKGDLQELGTLIKQTKKVSEMIEQNSALNNVALCVKNAGLLQKLPKKIVLEYPLNFDIILEKDIIKEKIHHCESEVLEVSIWVKNTPSSSKSFDIFININSSEEASVVYHWKVALIGENKNLKFTQAAKILPIVPNDIFPRGIGSIEYIKDSDSLIYPKVRIELYEIPNIMNDLKTGLISEFTKDLDILFEGL